jgi:uncharacterized protein YdiU (UPF0061 family)
MCLLCYAQVLLEQYQATMASKLGLSAYDKPLTGDLLQLMVDSGADWTNTWRCLADLPQEGQEEAGSSGQDGEGGGGGGEMRRGGGATLGTAWLSCLRERRRPAAPAGSMRKLGVGGAGV